MKIIISIIGALWLASCASELSETAQLTASTDTSAGDDIIQIMVVGAYHMGNPGQDVVNAEIDSVLTLERQAELDDVAKALSKFNPTAIAVERISEAPDYIDEKFQTYAPKDLAEKADERYQIAYRLADMTGVDRVFGIDEQPSDDEPDYFPFGKLVAHAEVTDQEEDLTAQIAMAQEMATRFSEMQSSMSVAELLMDSNYGPMSGHDFYYDTFFYDRGEDQPGAELQAYWFMRNAKIFSKLIQVSEPGDRIVVVYGAGHKYWLDHFAENTNGFSKVEVRPYLQAAISK